MTHFTLPALGGPLPSLPFPSPPFLIILVVGTASIASERSRRAGGSRKRNCCGHERRHDKDMELCRNFRLVHRQWWRVLSLSRRTLIYKLSEICGKDLLVLSGNGVASLLLFRSRASSLMHLVATDTEEEDERAMDRIAQKIVMESRDCSRNGNVYQTKTNMDIALQPVSPTLLTLLTKVSGKLGSTTQGAMIGNIITNNSR